MLLRGTRLKKMLMENVFFISNPENLKFLNQGTFDRIYFGNEFCARLLPAPKQLTCMLEFCERHSRQFSLVTPPCLDSTIASIQELLNLLPASTEVIFNDWGLVPVIKESNLIPVHGRLLCSIKKDPRINPAPDNFENNFENNEYFKTNNLQKEYQQLLLSRGINRVELDNVIQGYSFNPEKTLQASLYYPFVQCSITFKCFFANEQKKRAAVIETCARQCTGKSMSLRTIDNKKVFVVGNAQFYVNNNMPRSPEQWNINRLVYMPQIPNQNNSAAKIDWNGI
ncbi:MAG: hypothetical protein GY754_19565 [bacterium]|nr:hypothetical protein [bacterium]